jgi:diguanylate cyclase (GGDEF)-like protein
MKRFRLLTLKENSAYGISYRASLARVTRYGTYITAGFFLLFALVYKATGYPITAVGVNIICLLCSVTGYVLITRYKLHRLTAHLLTFAIYFSSTGVMALSDGIGSSSVVWQIFVPVAASTMAGLRAGLFWGCISLATVIGFFTAEQLGIPGISPDFHTTQVDLLIDLCGAIIAASIAVWFSDNMKSRSLSKLEETETRLNFYATTDPLTKTFNRRYFFEKSQGELLKTGSNGEQIAFLLFDIDHFKNINDLHGHLAGDQILQGLAGLCFENLRSEDILGRFGGEEFVILLPNMNIEKAKGVAERLRAIISQTPIATDAGDISITVSIGVSVMDASKSVSLDTLLSRADKAMYSAKQAGRNQVIIWDDEDVRNELAGFPYA